MKRTLAAISCLLLLCTVARWSTQSGNQEREPEKRVRPSANPASIQVSSTKKDTRSPAQKITEKDRKLAQKIAIGESASTTKIANTSRLGPEVLEVLDAEWNGPPGKDGTRIRSRIVRTDFKYPILRYQERVQFDPAGQVGAIQLQDASVASHVLVGLVDGIDEEDGIAHLKERGYELVSEKHESVLRIRVPAANTVNGQELLIEALEALPDLVAFAEPDFLIWPSVVPNDPSWALERRWSLHNEGTSPGFRADADIDAPEGWELRTTAPEVVVAVTDTGILHTHEDLVSNLWQNPGETPGDGIDNDGNGVIDDVHGYDAVNEDGEPLDQNGHGTHVAGTIGARGSNALGITGIAWEVRLMAAQNLPSTGPGVTSDAVKAISYARQNGAHLINASWGGRQFSQALYDAIEECAEAGILFVAAAGNDSLDNDATPAYPASYDLWNIVSVAATDGKDELAEFSNWGRTSVDLAAPGVAIWSSYIPGNASYRSSNGTSMAAPHVTGVLALMKAQFPTASASELLTRLFGALDSVPRLAEHVRTRGRLNLAKALQSTYDGPSNDHFENALELRGPYWEWSGFNEDATREPGENSFAPGTGNRSLWFAWTPPVDGLVELRARADSHCVLTAFRGTEPAKLFHLGQERGSDVLLRFYAEEGTNYRISLDSTSNEPQPLHFGLRLFPDNDNLQDAATVSGEFFSLTGNNFGATSQPFEQSHPHAGAGVGKSVWYKWTAPLDGNFVITTAGSPFDTVLAVYTVDDPAHPVLNEVTSNDDRSAIDWTSQVTINARTGTDYYLAVDSYSESSAGEFTLSGLREGQLVIVRQPQDVQAPVGGHAEFSVRAIAGNTQIEYQWFRGTDPLPGQIEERLSFDPVREEDFGDYHVIVHSPSETLASASAFLSEERLPPAITWSSGSQSALAGSTLTMGVQVTGSTPLTYRWFKNGVAVPQWTDALVTVTDAQEEDSGLYRIEISNELGQVVEEFQTSIVRSEFDTLATQYGTGRGEILDIVRQGTGWLALTSHKVYRSDDGNNWEGYPLPIDFLATHLAATSTEIFVAGRPLGTGEQWAIVRSSNLKDWTLIPLAPFRSPRALVAVGDTLLGVLNGAGDHLVATSTDGENWSPAIVTDPGGLPALIHTTDLKIINDMVFVLDELSGTVFSSSDGFNWIKRDHLPDAFWDGRYFVIDRNTSLSSVDLVTWEAEPSFRTPGNEWWGTIGEDLVGLRANTARIERWEPSTDGTALESQVDPSFGHRFTAAHFSERGLVMGTNHGHLGLAREVGEIVFPTRPTIEFRSISWHDGRWLAGGLYENDTATSILLQSSDGRRWEEDRLGPAKTTFLGQHGRYWWAPSSGFGPARRGHSLQTLQDHNIFAEDGTPRSLVELTSHNDTLLGHFRYKEDTHGGGEITRTVLGVSRDGGDSWTFLPDAPRPGEIDYVAGTWFLRNARRPDGTGLAATWRSTDTLNWEPVEFIDSTGSLTNRFLSDRILHHHGMYYALSEEETTDFGSILLRSTDGIRWIQSTIEGLLANSLYHDPQLYQVGGNLVAASFSHQTFDPMVGYSPDGQQWFRVHVPLDMSGLSFHGNEGVMVSRSSGIQYLPATRRHEAVLTETWNTPAFPPAGQPALWTRYLSQDLPLPEISAGDLVEGDRAFEIDPGGYAHLNATNETGASFQPHTRYRITLRAARTSVPAGNQLEFGLWAGVPADPNPLTAVNEAALTTPSLGSTGILDTTALPGNTMLELPHIDNAGKTEFLFETGDIPPSGDLVLFLRNTSNNAAPVYLDYIRLTADIQSPDSTNAAPIVALTNLGDPASVSLNATLPIEVQAEDPDGTVTHVEFYLDGTLIATDSALPYSHTIRFERAGRFTLTVRAFDDSGAQSVASVPIDVGHQAPQPRAESFDVPVIQGSRSWSGEPGEGRDLVAAYLDFLWRSSDGRVWRKQPLPVSGNGFVLVEGRDSLLLRDGSTFYASRDGVNWTRVLSLPEGRPNLRAEVRNGHFIMRGFHGGSVSLDHMLVSHDGFNWRETIPSITMAKIQTPVPSDDFSVWVGFHSENGLSYSLDGGNYWQPVPKPAPDQLVGDPILHQGTFFAASGSDIWSSDDGVIWSSQRLPVAEIAELFARGRRLFARAADKTWTSENGSDWTFVDFSLPPSDRVVWSESGFLIWSSAISSWIRHSLDGLTWSDFSAGLPAHFETANIVGFGSNYLLTTRDGDSYLWDGEATSWELVHERSPARPSHQRLQRLGGGNGILMAIGSDNWIRSSDGGESWQEVSTPASLGQVPLEIVGRNGKLFALFDDELWSSGDGDVWSLEKSLPDPQIKSVFWGADHAYLLLEPKSMYVVPLNQPGWTRLPVISGASVIQHFGAIGNQPFAIVQTRSWDDEYVRWYTFDNNSWTDHGEFPLPGGPNGWDSVEAHGLLVAVRKTGSHLAVASMNLAGPQVWQTDIDTQDVPGGLSLIATPTGFLAWGSENWTVSADLSHWEAAAPFVRDQRIVSSIDGKLLVLDQNERLFVVPDFDLALEYLVPPAPADYQVGDTLAFDLFLRNPGTTPTIVENWTLETWLSTDQRIGDLDNQLISTAPLSIDPPAPGEEIALSHSVQIPESVEAGSFRLFVRLRHAAEVDEMNSFNNIAATDEPVVHIALRRLRIIIDGDGTVSGNDLREFYPDGAVVNLFARANKGSVFSRWSGDAQGGLSETTVIMSTDRSVQAGFSPVANLGIRIHGAGAVTQSRSGGVYDIGELATLHASPEPGWIFAGWSGDLAGSLASESLLMERNKNVGATFVLPYSNWKAMHFSAEDLNDPMISGDEIDIDGDGLALWQEYLRGGNPHDRSSPGKIAWQTSPGYLSMIFTRISGPGEGYGLFPRASLDLIDWSSLAPATRVLSTDGAVETIEARIPRGDQESGFLRLEYRRP